VMADGEEGGAILPTTAGGSSGSGGGDDGRQAAACSLEALESACWRRLLTRHLPLAWGDSQSSVRAPAVGCLGNLPAFVFNSDSLSPALRSWCGVRRVLLGGRFD
jgi:hypothetical protein